ncbi:MAG: 2Fe-2S iron-sulfur cluster-binding protein [Atopobiaceae bacterium]|jgi:succinate dehydrogenase / fumarate reductase iron-sulfur subunit
MPDARVRIAVRRQRDPESPSSLEAFEYVGPTHVSVLHVLEWINGHPASRVAPEGEAFEPIAYECSCEQGLCGACAMVVSGTPMLACQAFVDEVARSGVVEVGPLTKFPLVRDLVVDRTAMDEAMASMRSWLEGEALVTPRLATDQYQAGLCLMCGCCLEACPNYAPGAPFCGAAGALGLMGTVTKESDEAHREDMRRAYQERFFSVCSKSGACERACPAGLPTMTLVSQANRASVWGFWRRIGQGR